MYKLKQKQAPVDLVLMSDDVKGQLPVGFIEVLYDNMALLRMSRYVQFTIKNGRMHLTPHDTAIPELKGLELVVVTPKEYQDIEISFYGTLVKVNNDVVLSLTDTEPPINQLNK